MIPFVNGIDKIASRKNIHFWMFFAVLLILSILMTYSYPIQPGHDFHFHYTRFNALIEALNDGRFPYYIDYTAANGYGYFTSAFYCDLILVPFAFIGTFTNTIFAYQSMLFVMTIFTGIFMYISVNKIYNSSYAASVSGILYAFAYYRLLDIYRRGALGESLSFTFVPVIFLGLYHIIKGDYRKWYILALGFTGIIFCHVISSVLMFITAIIILLIYIKPLIREPKRIIYLCLSGLVTLALIAYYLYPLVEQMLSNTFYYQTKAVISDIDAQKQVYEIIRGLFSGIIYHTKIFIPGTGVILTILICLRFFIRKKSKALQSIDIGLLIGLFYIFASSVYFPWHIFPFNKLGFIQLPWRLYEFSTFFFALAGGYYFSLILESNLKKFLGMIFLMLLTVFMIVGESKNYRSVTTMRVDLEPTIGMDYHLGMMEYLPQRIPSPWYIELRGNNIYHNDNNTRISNLKKEKGITSLDVNVTNRDILELPLTYYKGYTASLNGKEISTNQSYHGLLEIPVNESGTIKVIYSGTFTQKVSPYITLISIITLCLFVLISNRRKKNGQSA